MTGVQDSGGEDVARMVPTSLGLEEDSLQQRPMQVRWSCTLPPRTQAKLPAQPSSGATEPGCGLTSSLSSRCRSHSCSYMRLPTPVLSRVEMICSWVSLLSMMLYSSIRHRICREEQEAPYSLSETPGRAALYRHRGPNPQPGPAAPQTGGQGSDG